MSGLEIIDTGDGSHSLWNSSLNETYHSTHGAVQESNHVFVTNGLQHWLKNNNSATVSILEIGFGTGLNALLTLSAASQSGANIHYTTVEAFPVELQIIERLNYSQKIDYSFAARHFRLIHETEWNTPVPISSKFTLEKIEGTMQELNFQDEAYDVIFFDAFAPNKQPEMWERAVLSKIAKAMRRGSVFVTYCAKGQLKRDLKSLGLSVETLDGPPGKREMVRAQK